MPDKFELASEVGGDSSLTSTMLLHQYGSLNSVAQLALLLGRSVGGLRFTLRGESSLAEALCAARVRIGRRVHFRTREVADLLEHGTPLHIDDTATHAAGGNWRKSHA